MSKQDKRFFLALAFCQVGLVIFAISMFGFYYSERITKTRQFMANTNRKLKILRDISEQYDSDMKLKQMEWDYSIQGIGAEEYKLKKKDKQ